jgi:hypothetical protein
MKFLNIPFLQPPVTSSLFSPNILLSTLFSNTPSLCSSLNRFDQVPLDYKSQAWPLDESAGCENLQTYACGPWNPLRYEYWCIVKSNPFVAQQINKLAWVSDCILASNAFLFANSVKCTYMPQLSMLETKVLRYTFSHVSSFLEIYTF